MYDETITGFKLLDGSELIGKLDSETDTHYKIKDALFWTPVEVQPEKYDIRFYPVSYGIKMKGGYDHGGADLDLPKIATLFSYDIREEIVAKYSSLISPIVLATSF